MTREQVHAAADAMDVLVDVGILQEAQVLAGFFLEHSTFEQWSTYERGEMYAYMQKLAQQKPPYSVGGTLDPSTGAVVIRVELSVDEQDLRDIARDQDPGMALCMSNWNLIQADVFDRLLAFATGGVNNESSTGTTA